MSTKRDYKRDARDIIKSFGNKGYSTKQIVNISQLLGRKGARDFFRSNKNADIVANLYVNGGELYQNKGNLTDPIDVNKVKREALEHRSDPRTTQKLIENYRELGIENPEKQAGIDTIKSIIGIQESNFDFTGFPTRAGEKAITHGRNIQLHAEADPSIARHELSHSGEDEIGRNLSNLIIQKYGRPIEAQRRKFAAEKGFIDYNPETFTYTNPQGQRLTDSEILDQLYPVTNLRQEDMRRTALEHAAKISRDGELYGRVQQIRGEFGLKPGDVVDDKMIQRFRKESGERDLFRYYTNDEIKDFLNDLALNTNIDQFGNVAALGGLLTNMFPDGGNLNNTTDPRLELVKSKSSEKLKDKINEVKSLNRQRQAYLNPEKRDITTDNFLQNTLFKNDWLLDVPIVGDFIKDKAKQKARESMGRPVINEGTEKYMEDNKKDFSGKIKKDSNLGVDLVDQYFSSEKTMPLSKYKPKSDYMEFLDTYSLKENFDKEYEKNPKKHQENLEKSLHEILANTTDDDDVYLNENYDKELKRFLKDKKTRFWGQYGESEMSINLVNANLGAHKTGLAWDDEVNLPYISIADAWDFKPDDYSKKWENKRDNLYSPNEAYQQSYLMHKAGHPFKVYDRFYFDPKTKKYISDLEIEKLKNKKKT